MKEIMVSGSNLPNAYHSALIALNKFGEETGLYVTSGTQKECSMTIIVEDPLKEPRVSRLFIGGPYELQQYVMEILDGILDFELKLGNWPYTYHDRYAKWLNKCIDELKRNPYSRRAVISIRDNEKDFENDDPACLQNVQFFIRNNKLDCKVLFRSNDACKATFMNMFAFIELQKKVAKELKINVGKYIHRANSFHCYDKDYRLLESYCKRIKENGQTYYNYVGGWKELMDNAKKEIMSEVTCLKIDSGINE